MSIFTNEQQTVIDAADEVSRSDANLKTSIAALIGETLKARKLATIPDADQDALVSDLLTLVRTAPDGNIWSVADCRKAKPGTAMRKAGQRYETISKAYKRMKPESVPQKGADRPQTKADPKKPGKVTVTKAQGTAKEQLAKTARSPKALASTLKILVANLQAAEKPQFKDTPRLIAALQAALALAV